MPMVQINTDKVLHGLTRDSVVATDGPEVKGVWVQDGFGDPVFLVEGEYTLLPDEVR